MVSLWRCEGVSYMKEVNFEFGEIPGFAGWKIRTKVWYVRKFKKNSPEAKEYKKIESLLYAIYKTLDSMHATKKYNKNDNRKSNYRYFSAMLFMLCKGLNDKNKIKLPLPWYWYVWGTEIEWCSLDEIINKVGYQVKINGVRGKDMSIEKLQEIAEHNPG